MAPGPDPVTDKAAVFDTVDINDREDGELEPLISTKRRPANAVCSCRYITSYLAFLGLTCAFMNRVNISVAITAMANSTYSSTYNPVNSSAEVCPERSDGNKTEEDVREGEFPWDAHTQEQILAAFYYGFPFLQIPSGLLADKYPRSCTLVIGIGYLISSASNLFIPLAAYNGGAPAIMALRIISGLAESGSYPCLYSLMSRWSPEADRSKLLAIVFAGLSVGQIIAQPISGLLSESEWGWPSTFYLFGSLGVLWYIPWVLFVYHSPMAHPRISEEERDYIVAELNLACAAQRPEKYPWKDFFTSMPLYAVCVTDFALLWVLYSLTANLPIFLKEALRFDISQAGIISAVPHITLFICITGGGVLADFLLTHTKLSLTAVRKIMTTLGLLPSGIFLVLAGSVGCNAVLSIIFLSLGLATTGIAYSGASLTMMEFAPLFAGMVVAIANTIATIPGFVAPLVVAVYTENQADIGGWRTFFWISFGIAVTAWVIFMIFGTSEVQPWSKGVKDTEGGSDSKGTKYGGITTSSLEFSSDKAKNDELFPD